MINHPYEYKLLCFPSTNEKQIGEVSTRRGTVDLDAIINFEEAVYSDTNCTKGVGIYLADGSHFTMIGDYDDFTQVMKDKGLINSQEPIKR